MLSSLLLPILIITLCLSTLIILGLWFYHKLSAKLVFNQQIIQDKVHESLHRLNEQLDSKLHRSFEQSSESYAQMIKRLTLIDTAQSKLSELSTDIVSLQSILTDKRARGAFGEFQLQALIQNALPAKHYAFQHPLSNGTRVDCALFLPKPTGTLTIDSKFPLENYKKMTQPNLSPLERKPFEQQFVKDMKYHIQSIAEKYILPNETAQGAILFLPAESIFAAIHEHFPQIVDFSHRYNVWLTSPTTLMALITTAGCVLKEEQTKEHIHIIQEQLNFLAKDFLRFQDRMDKMAKHIDQTQADLQAAQVSASKITKRFQQIENVPLEPADLS